LQRKKKDLNFKAVVRFAAYKNWSISAHWNNRLCSRTLDKAKMSLFKKPKKSLQKNARIFSSEIEQMDTEEDHLDEDTKTKKKDKKDKSVKPAKSSLLSFGDEGIWFALFFSFAAGTLFIQLISPSFHDHSLLNCCLIPEEEGETFQVKKSSFSRRIHKERKKNKSSDKEISKNSQNSISIHDNVLKQSSPTSSATKDSFVKEIQSDDGFSVRLLLFNFTIKNTQNILVRKFHPLSIFLWFTIYMCRVSNRKLDVVSALKFTFAAFCAY
jgi:hypothetical protein